MADNVTLPGTGSVVGTDDVGGVQYQQVKLVDGTLDSSTPIGTNSNPLKATGPDCVSLLSTTITVEGASASMDTSGYGAVVAQISGVWQGNCTFEASNDGTVWDTVLVFSRDNLSLQDIITSGGLFTVRPSGRYLRINVQEINGSMVINALGRAAEGIAAADILSLAMDGNNNTPLNVTSRGSLGLPMVQDSDGYQGVAGKVTTYRGQLSLSVLNAVVSIPCDGYMTAMLSLNVSGGGGAVVEVFNGVSWAGNWGTYINNSTGNPGSQGQAVASGNIPYTVPLYGASMVRIRCSVNSSGSTCTYSIALSPFPLPTHILANVSQATAGNLLGTVNATIASTTTVATTNGQSLDTNIITATAAAVRQVKASAGRITMLQVSNGAANVGYLHLQNSAAAATSTAAVMTFAIPATAGANISIALPQGGLFMSAGIAYTVSGAIASGDVTALTAPSIAVNFSYI